MSETCTKCGTEPRAKFSAWGKKCLAAAAKARRATRHATPDATAMRHDATPADDHGLHAAMNRAEGLALAVAERDKRIEALEADVRHLKRQLAEARALLAREPVDAIGIQAGGREPTMGKVCIHGSRNCQALVCRAGR